MNAKNEFPQRLQRLRERRKMDRGALGECCGLSKATISKYERGEREPTSGSLEKLADFFNITMDELWRNQKNF